MLAKVRNKIPYYPVKNQNKKVCTLKRVQRYENVKTKTGKRENGKIPYFGGFKQTSTNIQKRLKHIDGSGGIFERKVFGAFSFFRNFLKKMKNYNQIIWWFQIYYLPLRLFHIRIRVKQCVPLSS